MFKRKTISLKLKIAHCGDLVKGKNLYTVP